MIRKHWIAVFLLLIFIPTPSFANTALERGLYAAKEGQWDIATEAFMEAWQEEPLSPVVLFNLGLAHAKFGASLPAIAWLEAYLASDPDASNKVQIRSTIAQLEVKTRASMNKLFEQELAIIEQVSIKDSFTWYEGKHSDANMVAGYLADTGKIEKAYQVAALAKKYAQQAGMGGSAHHSSGWFLKTNKQLLKSYGFKLAGSGNLVQALKQAKDEEYRNAVFIGTLKSSFSSGAEVHQALMGGDAYRSDTIAYAARNLWLNGDVEGLKYLADWLKDKNEEYYPAMLEVAHGLLGLGYEENAIAFARMLPQTYMLAARYATRLLYEQPDINYLACYEREVGRSTLWRMLEVRYFALKGNSERANSHTEIPMGQRRSYGKAVTGDMKSDHAWSRAFEQYAAGNINEAKSIMTAAGQDVTSFLIITLRNAATRDPLYAGKIALAMEPAYLGPILLSEASRQARQEGDKARANILKLAANKRASALGSRNNMPLDNGQLKDWINLGILYSQNSTVSDFSGVLRQIADGGVPAFEPLMPDVPFVRKYYNYNCPPKDTVESVKMKETVPRAALTDLSHAAAFLGEGLLQLRARRSRHSLLNIRL